MARAGLVRVTVVENPLDRRDRDQYVEPAGRPLLKYAPKWFIEDDPLHVCIHNGGVAEDLSINAQFGDDLHFVKQPGLFIGTAGATGFKLFLINVANAALATAYSAAINAALRSLIRPSRRPIQRGERDSPTYSFLGIESNYNAEGSVIAAGGGKVRLGGTIIQRFTKVESSPPTTTLFLLLQLGEGVFNKIGDKTESGGPFFSGPLQGDTALPAGLEINGQPAQDLQNVECYVRMGDVDQEVIPLFEDTSTQANVGVTLSNAKINDSGGDNPNDLTGTSTLSVSALESLWSEAGFYTMSETADEAAAIINFPQGLYSSNDAGQVAGQLVEYQAAYVEVDSGGTPIVGKEYVVLPKRGVVNSFTSAFQVEYPIPFYDSDSYTAPVRSNFVNSVVAGTGSIDQRLRATMFAHPSSAPASETEWTWSAWIRPGLQLEDDRFAYVDTGLDLILRQDMTLFRFLNGNRGFAVYLIRLNGSGGTANDFIGNPAGFGSVGKLGIRVELGDGSSVTEFDSVAVNDNNSTDLEAAIYSGLSATDFPGPGGETDYFGLGTLPWVHVAFTYRAESSPGAGDQRFVGYVNGSEFARLTSADGLGTDYRWPANGSFLELFGSSLGNTSDMRPYRGWFDCVRFYDRERSQGEIQSEYAGGSGFSAVSAEEDNGLIGGWNLDSALTDVSSFSQSLTVFTPLGFEFVAGANLGAVFDIPTTPRVTGKRFKIALQRLTPSNIEDEQIGQNEFRWDTVRLTTLQPYTNPGEALLGLKIRATDQLNTSSPTVTVPCEQRVINMAYAVGSGFGFDDGELFVDETPTLLPRYTTSPIWHAIDIMVNARFGAGDRFTYADFDLVGAQEAHKHCAELVYKGGDTITLDNTQTALSLTVDTGFETATLYVESAAAPDDIAQWRGETIKFRNWTDTTGVGVPPTLAPHLGWTVTGIGFEESSTPLSLSSGDYWSLELRVDLETPDFTNHITFDFSAGILTGGTVERVVPRYAFNGVFDRQSDNPWDSFIAILACARTVPILTGGRISFFQDRARNPVSLVSMNNIVKGSFGRTEVSPFSQANASSIQFLDEDRNWEASTIDDVSSLQDSASSGASRKPRAVFRIGITNRNQALRTTRLDTRQLSSARFAYQWAQELSAINFDVGDVIELQHDRIIGTIGGQIYQDSSANNQTFLDRPLVIAYATSYTIRVGAATGTGLASFVIDTVATVGSGEPGAYPATIPVGSPITVVGGLPGTSGGLYNKGTSYAVGQSPTKTVQIIDIAKPGDQRVVTVQAIDYDGDLYDDAEDITDIDVALATETGGDQGDLQASPTDQGVPLAPESFVAEESGEVTEGGDVVVTSTLRWRVPGGQRLGNGSQRLSDSKNQDARAELWFTPQTVARGTTGSPIEELTWRSLGEIAYSAEQFRCTEPLRRDVTYAFAIQPISKSGARTALERCRRTYLTPAGIVPMRERATGATTRAVGERSVLAVPVGQRNRAKAWEARRGGWLLGQYAGHGAGPEIPLEGFATTKTSSATGLGRPYIHVAPIYGNGQVGDPVRTEEAAPSRSGSWTNLIDVNLEDASWAGTLTELQVEAAPSAADQEFLPPILRGSKLKFTGSELEGSYVPQQALFSSPIWVWVSAHADAIQVPDFTTDTGPTLGTLAAEKYTTEGSTYADDPHCELFLEWRITDEGSFDGSEPWIRFLPGRHRFRLAEWRIRVTRPTSDFDVSIRRFNVRVTRIPSRRIDYLASKTFGGI